MISKLLQFIKIKPAYKDFCTYCVVDKQMPRRARANAEIHRVSCSRTKVWKNIKKDSPMNDLSMTCCLVVTCCERADNFALVCDVYYVIVTFCCGILGQVWYLIVSIPDLCCLSYFYAYAIKNRGLMC